MKISTEYLEKALDIRLECLALTMEIQILTLRCSTWIESNRDNWVHDEIVTDEPAPFYEIMHRSALMQKRLQLLREYNHYKYFLTRRNISCVIFADLKSAEQRVLLAMGYQGGATIMEKLKPISSRAKSAALAAGYGSHRTVGNYGLKNNLNEMVRKAKKPWWKI